MGKDLFIEIFVPTWDENGHNQHGERGRFGTGYPVSTNLLLTARHVVVPETAKVPQTRDRNYPIEIRWSGSRGTRDYRWLSLGEDPVVWSGQGDMDAALVRIPASARPRGCQGHGDLMEDVPEVHTRYWAAGFPVGGQRHGENTKQPFSGKIEKSHGSDAYLYAQVTSDFESRGDWSGASGMPIVCDDRIAGIVVEVQTKATNRLTCISAFRLRNDPEFRLYLLKDRWSSQSTQSRQEDLVRLRLEKAEAARFFDHLRLELGCDLKSAPDLIEMLKSSPANRIDEYFDRIPSALFSLKDEDGVQPREVHAAEAAAAALYYLAATRLVDEKACALTGPILRVPYDRPLICAVIAAAVFGGSLELRRAEDTGEAEPRFVFKVGLKPGTEHQNLPLEREIYSEIFKRSGDAQESSQESKPLSRAERNRLTARIRKLRNQKKYCISLIVIDQVDSRQMSDVASRHDMPFLVHDNSVTTDLLGMDAGLLSAMIDDFVSELESLTVESERN